MDFENLKNKTLTKLKICKREEEADDVLVETHQKLMNKDSDAEERYQFWEEIFDELGERDVSSLEAEANNTADPILKLSRERIKEIMEKENKES